MYALKATRRALRPNAPTRVVLSRFGTGILLMAVSFFSPAQGIADQEAQEASPWVAAQLLRTELYATPLTPAENVDVVMPMVKRLTFTMGMLLSETDLDTLLGDLESSDDPIDTLILAAFWLDYGEERTVRRLGRVHPDDLEPLLLSLADHEAVVVRASALALVADKHGTTNAESQSTYGENLLLPPKRIRALNELALAIPNTQVFETSILNAIVDHLAARWTLGDGVKTLFEFYGWNNAVLNTIGDLSSVQQVLAIASLSHKEGMTELVQSALDYKGSSADAAMLALLDTLDETYVGDTPPLKRLEFAIVEQSDKAINSDQFYAPHPAVILTLLNDALRHDQLDDAQLHLANLQDADLSALQRPAGLLRAANGLAMALVRADREAEAIAAFSALASFTPRSQAADYAEEHIVHLSRGLSAD